MLVRKHSPASARLRIFDGVAEANLIALACSEPPKGRKRWTLQRLEEQVVELKIVDRASDNTIGRTLNKPCPAASAEATGHPTGCQRRGPSHGELSIMVGATPEPFSLTQPILETMGTDVTHCGPVGCGQVVKILNNMSVFQHCGALAEAIAIGRRNGVPADVLLPTIAMGPGDSFVLRNHGMKAMLADVFPKREFSTRYVLYAGVANASGLDVTAGTHEGG